MQEGLNGISSQLTRICSNPNCIHKNIQQPLDANYFAPNANYKSGFKTRCRDCERQARRERYQRKRNEELAYNREWVAKHRKERNAYQNKRNHEIMQVYYKAIKKSA